MSTLRYKDNLVICCCANCLNAVDYKMINAQQLVRCQLDDQYRHLLSECGSYEFSAWRYAHNRPATAREA